MEQNLFQNTLTLIENAFPDRKNTLLLMMVCKPDQDQIRLCAKLDEGYTDCLLLPVYENRKVAEILAEVKKELARILSDQASIDQWDAVAIWISPDGQMQVSFDDDDILEHWDRPELLSMGM